MKNSTRTLGRFFLQLALACLLAVGGIWALQGGGDFGANAVVGFLGNPFGTVFGVLELVAGVLLLIGLFAGDALGGFGRLLGWIIMVVWAIAIVVGDIMGFSSSNFLSWLYNFAMHLIVFGALWSLND